jgi:hypothetical protein
MESEHSQKGYVSISNAIINSMKEDNVSVGET